jgi:hypothetical protein
LGNAESILKAILKSQFAEDYFGQLQTTVEEDIARYGYSQRVTDYSLDMLSSFFEQDLSDILKVEEVWTYLSKELHSEIDGLHSVVLKEFLLKLDPTEKLSTERGVEDVLKELHSILKDIYSDMLDDSWKGLTPEQAQDKLRSGIGNMLYVALLDDNEHLVGEPYPALSKRKHPAVEVTAKITTGKYGVRRVDEIHIEFKPSIEVQSITDETINVGGQCHFIKGNEATSCVLLST